MFTTLERDHVRDSLIAAAREDSRITGAAWFGSTASGAQDEWSDVDIMLAVDEARAIPALLDDWTGRMRHDHGAVHHVDVIASQTVYRVFLLASTLQVDIAFAPGQEFGALSPKFQSCSAMRWSGRRCSRPRPSTWPAWRGSMPCTRAQRSSEAGCGRPST